MKLINLAKHLSFVIFCVVFLSACNLNDDEMAAALPVSYVSIYHAAPSNAGLNVHIDNIKYNNQLFKYKNFSGYNSYYTGITNFKFISHDATTILVDTSLNLVENKVYSMFIVGDTNNLKSYVVEDIWSEPSTGKAMVRLVNLSKDAPALDIFVDNDNEALFTGRNYKTATNFKEIEIGEKNLTLKAVGGNETLLTLPDFLFEEKRIYTVVVSGYVNTPDVNANMIIQVLTNHTILY